MLWLWIDPRCSYRLGEKETKPCVICTPTAPSPLPPCAAPALTDREGARRCPAESHAERRGKRGRCLQASIVISGRDQTAARAGGSPSIPLSLAACQAQYLMFSRQRQLAALAASEQMPDAPLQLPTQSP